MCNPHPPCAAYSVIVRAMDPGDGRDVDRDVVVCAVESQEF